MKTKTERAKTGKSRERPHDRVIDPELSAEPELMAARRQPLKVSSILVPIDFSDESKKALLYAARFAEDYGARLHLLHVIEPMPFVADMPNVVLRVSDQDFADQAKLRLADLAREELDEFIPASPEVRIGKPYQEIVAVAKAQRSDLIIISTHGYTGLKHAFLGSTAERVVRYAPCPVLVVRQKEHDFI